MIPNSWYAISRTSSVPYGRPLGLVRCEQALVLWRDDKGKITAFPDRCPHRNVQLSLGRLKDGQLECGYHGFRFDHEGQCRLIPANGAAAPVPKAFHIAPLPIAEKYGWVWLWNGDAKDANPEDIPWFHERMELQDLHACGDYEAEVDLPYSRFIEGAMDIHHFPHLHRRLSPGMGGRLDDFEATLEGDTIRSSGVLRRDGDANDKGTRFRIDLKFPNLIYLEFSPRAFATVAVTPTKEGHCVLITRVCQTYIRIPYVQRLLSWLMGVLDLKLTQLPEDLPMARSQGPNAVINPREYKLIEADKGIALYLVHREKLKKLKEAK